MSAELAALVAGLKYKPGWEFTLTSGPTMSSDPHQTLAATGLGTTGSYGGMTLYPDGAPLYVHARLTTPDSGSPENTGIIVHTFAAPPLARQIPGWNWERWLFESVIMAVERHEAGEWYEVSGFKPYYPEHGPLADPYVLKHRERP